MQTLVGWLTGKIWPKVMILDAVEGPAATAPRERPAHAEASENRFSKARQRRLNAGECVFARFLCCKLGVNLIEHAGELLVVMFFTVAQGLG
jgi:hypothetical protein